MENTLSNKVPEVVIAVVVRHVPTGRILLTKGSKWTVWGINQSPCISSQGFFHCLVESDSDEVNIDKDEIVDYRWIYPSEIGDYKTSVNMSETVKMITHSDQLEKKF
jgi:hypothetical protein